MATGTKELHNQPLVTTFDPAHRMALGYPGLTAANNMTPSVFMSQFMKFGKSINVAAGNNTITFATPYGAGIVDYSVFIRTRNGSGYTEGTITNTGFDVDFLEADIIDYLTIRF